MEIGEIRESLGGLVGRRLDFRPLPLNLEFWCSPAVYCLMRQEQAMYVGATTCVPARIIRHLAHGQRLFDDVVYLPAETQECLRCEADLIRLLDPPWNVDPGRPEGLIRASRDGEDPIGRLRTALDHLERAEPRVEDAKRHLRAALRLLTEGM